MLKGREAAAGQTLKVSGQCRRCWACEMVYDKGVEDVLMASGQS